MYLFNFNHFITLNYSYIFMRLLILQAVKLYFHSVNIKEVREVTELAQKEITDKDKKCI